MTDPKDPIDDEGAPDVPNDPVPDDGDGEVAAGQPTTDRED